MYCGICAQEHGCHISFSPKVQMSKLFQAKLLSTFCSIFQMFIDERPQVLSLSLKVVTQQNRSFSILCILRILFYVAALISEQSTAAGCFSLGSIFLKVIFQSER